MKHKGGPPYQREASYEELSSLSESCKDNEEWKSDKESYIYQKYSISNTNGRRFYSSLSDEELLKILKDKAIELGHPPSQKEVFWVWREYIKVRFEKWPYALTAADLPKNAGNGGIKLVQIEENIELYNQLLKIVREKAKELGRIPHLKDLPEECIELSKYKKKWQEIIKDAEINQNFFEEYSLKIIDDLEVEYKQHLKEVYFQANLLGRAPLRNEIDPQVLEKLVKRCGTWRNALYQIGLEPPIRVHPFSSTFIDHHQTESKRNHQIALHDCYYRVLSLDAQTISDLKFIKEFELKQKRMPEKKEIPKEIRLRLQEKCGSWANILNQIHYIEEQEDKK